LLSKKNIYKKLRADRSGENSPKKRKGTLAQLEKRAGWIIFKTQSLFPFDLFPDEITICPNRVTITRNALLVKDEYPLPIESINGARIYRSLFFASLTLETFGYKNPGPINNLSIKNARLARRYILGLVECNKNKIDISNYSLTKFRKRLNNIGMVQENVYGGHDIS